VLAVLWRERFRYGGIGARASAGLVALVMFITLVVFLGRMSIQVPVDPTALSVAGYALVSNLGYALFGSRAGTG
jgi:hypothetical protein